jgi:hypothetical protein
MDDSHPEQKLIRTAASVIDALGGTVAASKVAKTQPQAMTNARARNRLPYPTFLLMSHALAAIGRRADPRLWGIKPLERS